MKKTILQLTFIVLVVNLIFISGVYAATINVASPYGATQVQTAINAASAGDTVFIPESTAEWTSVVTVKAGIILMGAGRDKTKVTVSRQILVTGAFWRITGIGFTSNPLISPMIYSTTTEGWRIDNCSFTNNSTSNKWSFAVYGDRSKPNQRGFGLFDNNILTNVEVPIFYGGAYTASLNTEWVNDLALGTGNALFIENNTIINTMAQHAFTQPDANCGSRVVFRYNNVDSSNSAMHSVQGFNRGARMWEIYGNVYTANVFSTWVVANLRAGTGVMYNNTVGSGFSNGIALDNRRSFESFAPVGICDGTSTFDGNRSGQYGYPCRDQIGRSTDAYQMTVSDFPPQALVPAYFWNNKKGATDVKAFTRDVANPDGYHYLLTHIVENRDYYNADSTNCPANPAGRCTRGVGVGPLANRPASCTHIPISTGLTSGVGGDDVGAGVGYWATDTNTLYRCSATNTWTVHYKPYIYPHPLTTLAPVTKPAPPTSLRIRN